MSGSAQAHVCINSENGLEVLMNTMYLKSSFSGLQRMIAVTLIPAFLLSTVAAQNPASQSASSSAQGNFRIRVETELVLVNVVARDKQGKPIQDLKAEDFTLLEDGKSQHITSFDAEDLDTTPATTTASAGAAQQSITGQPVAPAKPLRSEEHTSELQSL